MSGALSMLVALAMDAASGWPDPVFRRIGHPVTWIGRMIAAADRRFNREEWVPGARRCAGVAVALCTIGIAAGAAAVAQRLLPGGWAGAILAGILAWPLVAARSLDDHVRAVAIPLERGDLAGARRAVAMIVGRDPASLDAAGVARAAIESLAENASDGIVAPLFWGAAFGLPGIAAYKAVNTLDSMIGHMTPRHRHFGWAAARIDDLANLIPARLTALLLAAVSGRAGAAFATMRRDARRHRSPNAGWPEAAMAGALAVRLSGPRIYAGHEVHEPWVNGEAGDPDAAAVLRGLRLYRAALVLGALTLGVTALGVALAG